MTNLVTVEIAEGIADVRFNRPDKHNSLTLEMFAAINDAGAALAANPAVRVVVLSGNGPSFCAGLDFSIMAEMLKGPDAARTVMDRLLARDGAPDNRAQRTAVIWKTMPMPVLAALHGVAFGGGCQIALGADMRFAAPDTRMSVMEIKYGLVPDMGLTQTLPDLVRLDVAKDLTLSGRIIDAEEACALGPGDTRGGRALGRGHAQRACHRGPFAPRGARLQAPVERVLARRRAHRSRARGVPAARTLGLAQPGRSGQRRAAKA